MLKVWPCHGKLPYICICMCVCVCVKLVSSECSKYGPVMVSFRIHVPKRWRWRIAGESRVRAATWCSWWTSRAHFPHVWTPRKCYEGRDWSWVAYMHAYIHTYMHTYIHTYTHDEQAMCMFLMCGLEMSAMQTYNQWLASMIHTYILHTHTKTLCWV